jgi:hypothetical protein
MAIGIVNYPNRDTSDLTAYPNGQIKNDPSGTPVNVLTNGDVQIFFDKLLRISGLTANGLPDNETNGYQLITALQHAARPYDAYVIALSQSGSADPTAVIMENTLSGTPVLARSGAGSFTITLTGEFLAAKTVAFISMQTTNRLGKITRVTDNGLLILVEDAVGLAADSFSAYVEVRVYR